jgi:hypothetical protein
VRAKGERLGEGRQRRVSAYVLWRSAFHDGALSVKGVSISVTGLGCFTPLRFFTRPTDNMPILAKEDCAVVQVPLMHLPLTPLTLPIDKVSRFCSTQILCPTRISLHSVRSGCRNSGRRGETATSAAHVGGYGTDPEFENHG